MGLLHKNLLFAGIASVAMVGLLGSSSASALDGFSFSDVINNYRNQTEQLQSYLTNPFGSGCEATNPDSTISCNETPFPNLLYSASSKENLWGHDGKGIIFTNNDNLVNGNPQLATAKRGDTLKISVAIEAENYYDDAKTDPIARYMLGSLNSCGLAVDRSSAIVKVNNQVVSADAYNVELYDIPKEEVEQAGYDFCNQFIVSLDWVDDSGAPLYTEGSTIEFTYEATIEEDAPSEVFGRGVYVYNSKAGHQEYSSPNYMTNTTFQATAILDGSILIRRVDANGNPLAGAKYQISGVKASAGAQDGFYNYDTSDGEDIFTTNEDGRIVVSSLPFGQYTVTEIEVPAGNTLNKESVTKTINSSTISFQKTHVRHFFNYLGLYMMGARQLNDNLFAEIPGSTHEMAYDDTSGSYYYDDESLNSSVLSYRTVISTSPDGKYYWERIMSRYGEPTTISSGELTYDNQLGKYIAVLSPIEHRGEEILSDYFGSLSFQGSNNATFMQNGDSYDLFLTGTDGCYHNQEETITVCRNGEGYQLRWIGRMSGFDELIDFEYNEAKGKYYAGGMSDIIAIDAVGSGPNYLYRYAPIQYSNLFEKYYYYMSVAMGLELGYYPEDEGIYCVKYLFSEPRNTIVPEDIHNPQTSDVIFKVLAISAITLLPAFAIRKHLTRR